MSHESLPLEESVASDLDVLAKSKKESAESDVDVLPEGFDRFPRMIALRDELVYTADNPLDIYAKFDQHIEMLHRTLPDEVLEEVSAYHILRGDYDVALRVAKETGRLDLEGEDYSICEFLKSLQQHD